jgi:hypothetical protein
MALGKKPYEILIRNIIADDKILRGLNNNAVKTKSTSPSDSLF